MSDRKPFEIARETLKQISARKLPPTPTNYQTVYHEISGQPVIKPFPEDELRAVAQAPVEVRVHPLVARRRVAARLRAGEPVLDRQVEDQRQVGLQPGERSGVQRLYRGARHALAVALIGHRRIGEAVGNHPGAAVERRRHGARHVLAPGRDVQQGLGQRVPAVGGAGDQRKSFKNLKSFKRRKRWL